MEDRITTFLHSATLLFCYSLIALFHVISTDFVSVTVFLAMEATPGLAFCLLEEDIGWDDAPSKWTCFVFCYQSFTLFNIKSILTPVLFFLSLLCLPSLSPSQSWQIAARTDPDSVGGFLLLKESFYTAASCLQWIQWYNACDCLLLLSELNWIKRPQGEIIIRLINVLYEFIG